MGSRAGVVRCGARDDEDQQWMDPGREIRGSGVL